MRIISGKLRGLRLSPPPNLPVRPTKDNAKEALFNILNNQLDFEQLTVLDLFSGTGSITIEFASRGVPQIVSVDKDAGCYNYLKKVSKQYALPGINAVRADALKFLTTEVNQYDLIFADPPYDLPQIPEIPQLIFERGLLKAEGLLIVEHPTMKRMNTDPHFAEQREYGYSSFSFFR